MGCNAREKNPSDHSHDYKKAACVRDDKSTAGHKQEARHKVAMKRKSCRKAASQCSNYAYTSTELGAHQRLANDNFSDGQQHEE